MFNLIQNMLPTINNIEEAERFFLNNSSGSCYCLKGDTGRVAECYPDAVEFYNTNN